MAPVAAAAAAEPVDRRSHALSESGLYRTRRGKRAVEKPAAGTDGNRGYAQRYRISVSSPDRPALPRRPLVFPTGDFAGSLPHASRNSRAERHAAGHPPPEPNRKNIFLTGPSNLSHYESVLDFVRYAGLGYLVGTNTGGCTGPINYLPLPSGHEVAFTGTKVLSNLGRSRYFYRTGIRPDRYVEETADDIRLGRDAALEEALRIAGAPPSAGNP